MVEIREAPVPVRWRWLGWTDYVASSVLWHNFSDINPCAPGFGLAGGDVISVELSSGQTVIVKAKK